MDISRKCVRFFFFVVAFLAAGQARADIYKCQQPDGSVKFSDVICTEGKAEPIVLLENSPLDSSAERENIARYYSAAKYDQQRKSVRQMPQVVLIEDSYTEERNARVSATVKPKKKKKLKAKKRRKQSAAAKTAAVETTH